MPGIVYLIVMFVVAAVAIFREKIASPSRIRRIQEKRLRRLIRRAKKNTPFYADLYRDIDPGKAVLADLPTIRKRDVMARLPDTLEERGVTLDEVIGFSQDKEQIGKYFRGKYVLCATSGTTGRVGYFFTTRYDWAVIRGVEFARLLRRRLGPKYLIKYLVFKRFRWAMLVATGGHYITYLLMKLTPKATHYLANIKPFSIMEPIPEMVEDLNKFDPHYLHGYPTFLEALAYEKLAGRLKIKPDFISSGSEPFSKTARAVLWRAFPDAELSETYGTTEALSLANQCACGRLHINEDYVILEAVDEHNRPVPPGTRSRRTLVTNLVNCFQPLIRYELNDSIIIHHADDVCPCGSPLRTVEVLGRSDDTFFLRDAMGHYHAFPPIPFEVLFLRVQGIRQYQLIHEEQNHLLIRYARSESSRPEEIEKNLISEFRGYLDS
ncbi:MAG: hypothetical protein WC889_20640, partial [Myxococcota bacterium]